MVKPHSFKLYSSGSCDNADNKDLLFALEEKSALNPENKTVWIRFYQKTSSVRKEATHSLGIKPMNSRARPPNLTLATW